MNFVQWKHSSLSLCFCSVHLNQVTGKGECLLREFCCFRIKMLHIVKKKKTCSGGWPQLQIPETKPDFHVDFILISIRKKKSHYVAWTMGLFHPVYTVCFFYCAMQHFTLAILKGTAAVQFYSKVFNNNIQYYVLPQCLTYHSPMVKTTQC